MKIAIEGCAHGELDKIYETIQYLECQNDIKVDLLIICGDFQAVRNKSDLMCMAVPTRFQKLNTFYKYYSGEKTAPILTIFVGGNHEASNYMSELAYGGWVCENIYYMGYASVVEVGGLRIAGLSGIYKGQDFLKGHFEILPYDESTKRSIYHVRNVDVFRLKQLVRPVDIFISHDWPRGIHEYGDKAGLLRCKPFFREDVNSGKLGSRPAEELLFKLHPSYWFAAHLHCEFAAIVPHDAEDGRKTFTKFLALDKCLPKRKFLKIIDVDCSDEPPFEIRYDPEWLSVLKSSNHLLNVTASPSYMPGKGCSDRWDFSASNNDLAKIRELFNNDLTIPKNFVHTADLHNPESTSRSYPVLHINPQTTVFCEKLGVDDPLQLLVPGCKQKNIREFSFTEDLNVTDISETSFNPDQSFGGDDEDSEFNGLFFIDRTGDRDDTFSSMQEKTSSPVPKTKQLPEITLDFPEYKAPDSSPPAATPTQDNSEYPLPIKIKRRNQSIYTADNEDNN